MAKTLKLNVSFPMTVVINSETVAAVEVTRKEAREELSGDCKATGEQLAFIKLFASEKNTEELFEILMRKGIRVGDIKVAYEKRSDVLARACDCNACYECKIARGGSDE